jgi:Glycosyl transferase family 2.
VLQQSVFKPFISVIITAFNRDTFLKDAIESALKQTLDKKVYEVIVVKNFDWEFDDVYSSRGVKNNKRSKS